MLVPGLLDVMHLQKQLIPFYNALLTCRRSRLIRFDEHFKFPKRIFALVDGHRQRPFTSLLVAQDEWGFIVSYHLCPTKEKKEKLSMLRGIKQRYDMQVRSCLRAVRDVCVAEMGVSAGVVFRRLLRGQAVRRGSVWARVSGMFA